MNAFLRKYAPLLPALLLVFALFFSFAQSKNGMFIDEIYTYGLSNSTKGAYLRDVAGGSLQDQVLSREELLQYVTVQEGEFSLSAVYDNQAADVHPPLYYWLFHLASALTPGLFSKWTGLGLNAMLFLFALAGLYALLLRLFEKPAVAAAGVALYGLSLLGLTTALMLRMYVLLTGLTVWMAYLILRLMEEKKPHLYLLLTLCMLAGLMTQYYFVFYAFFLCAAFVFRGLWQRDWKGTLFFALAAFAGVALLLLCFPPCLNQLFADKLVSGGNALENLGKLEQYRERLLYFYKEVRHGMKAAILVALAAAAALLVFCRRFLRAVKEGRIRFRALLLVIPALVTLVLVALISPVADQRYVYNLIPLFTVAVCMLLSWLAESTRGLPFQRVLCGMGAVCIGLFCFWFARWSVPLYQYPEHADYNTMLARHADSPCVYLTDEHFEPLTQDLIQLLQFDEVFTTADPASPALASYLAGFDSEEMVVYIDVDKFWSSGLEPEIMLPQLQEASGFSKAEQLYTYALSHCYLLT